MSYSCPNFNCQTCSVSDLGPRVPGTWRAGTSQEEGGPGRGHGIGMEASHASGSLGEEAERKTEQFPFILISAGR